jgi:hypothetical protein
MGLGFQGAWMRKMVNMSSARVFGEGWNVLVLGFSLWVDFGEILVGLGFIKNGQFWSSRVLSGRIVGLRLL